MTIRQATQTFTIGTAGQGLIDVTRDIVSWVDEQNMKEGLLTIFCRHTSASLLIQENAAPAARADLERFFACIAPEDPAAYTHDEEGPDDMPAHLRTALTQTHLSVPLTGGDLALGTWQGIYLFEHRHQPHMRAVVLHLLGE